MEHNVKLNDYNLLIISGEIDSVEQVEHEGHKYTRFYLKHKSDNGSLSIPVYLFDDGKKFHEMKDGDTWLITGKLRFNERKAKYKIIGVDAAKSVKGTVVNFAIVEALITDKQILDTGELLLGAMHLTLRKSEELDIYKLPLRVYFSRNRAKAVDAKTTIYKTYLIEGKLRYDAPTKSYGICGKHVKDTMPIIRPIPIAEVQ